MDSSFRERLERLGSVRDVERVSFGSPATIAIRPADGPENVGPVRATLFLARRGARLSRAKRAVEEMLDRGRAVVRLPLVEDATVLASDLAAAGVDASRMEPDGVDVGTLRRRLDLSQDEFALHYGLDVDAVQNWKAGRRRPDRAARSYLRVIDRFPDIASEALETPIA